MYFPKLNNFLRYLLLNEDEACDIAQDIFIKIWNKRVIFSQVGSFESYLFRMAKNAVYDYFEHNLVKERYIFINAFNISELDQISEDKIFAKDLEVLISMAVEKMPDKRKNV
ncbi:MAG: sigma factor, partial [Bacteroidales bacterium]|nr:sigma factor [Bacteroidales bacterium]